MRNFAAAVGAVTIVLALIVGGTYGYLALYKDAGPRFQEVERSVYEQTPSYVQGKTTMLTRLRLEYKRATSEAQKVSLKEMILSEASTVDTQKLPVELRSFLLELGGK